MLPPSLTPVESLDEAPEPMVEEPPEPPLNVPALPVEATPPEEEIVEPAARQRAPRGR